MRVHHRLCGEFPAGPGFLGDVRAPLGNPSGLDDRTLRMEVDPLRDFGIGSREFDANVLKIVAGLEERGSEPFSLEGDISPQRDPSRECPLVMDRGFSDRRGQDDGCYENHQPPTPAHVLPTNPSDMVVSVEDCETSPIRLCTLTPLPFLGGRLRLGIGCMVLVALLSLPTSWAASPARSETESGTRACVTVREATTVCVSVSGIVALVIGVVDEAQHACPVIDPYTPSVAIVEC